MSILAPGTLVGKYPVVRVMSSGGMGMIYEAVHPVLLTRVVIKTVLPTLAGEESIAERFRNEALAASRIRDDRLPQILDIDSFEDGTQYMVMEYLDGEDLQRRLATATVGADYGVRIIFEILEVLHKVHQIGIIHRDITPRNIFLARSDLFGEIPKLLDFGVAHFVNSPNTQSGEVLGSPFYMAPEQIHTHCDLGPWTDVFSAGVVLYEILSGRGSRPWPTGSLVEYLTAISTRKRPRDLGQFAPELPRGLCDAVMKAIRVDAGARFTDAASFAQAIEPFAADRATLYNSRRPSEQRRSFTPPTSSPELTTVQSTGAQVAIGTGVTMALPSSQIRGPLSTRPPAAALTGIQSQLAGMIKKPVQAPVRPRLREGERRHLTVLCLGMHLEGPPMGGLDGEDVDQLIQQITGLLERQIEGLGGHVMPPYDGSIMATFGHELATEEDAEHAVSAALALLEQRQEINATLAQIAYTLHLRAGVHSGFVTRERGGGREEVITGATIAAAKLLEHEAPPNGVLVSREALDLLGGRFAEQPFRKISLKARLDPLEAFEIKGTLGAEVQRWSRGGVAEAFGFVGREEPLGVLERVYARALALAKARETTQPGSSPTAPSAIELCVVSGGAGIGKSRLLHELLTRIGEDPERFTRVFRAQPASAAPYSVWIALLERVMFLPSDGRRDASLVFEQLSKLAVGLTGARRAELLSQGDIIASLLSMGGQDVVGHFAPVDQKARIQQTIALTLDAIAAPIPPARPAIVVLDNVQRADAASLEILDKVLGAMRSVVPPVLLIAVRDADLNLKLPENVTVTRVALEPLSRAEVSAMAAGIAGHALSPDAERLVQERGGRNPLFVEEIVLALGDQGMTRADAASLRAFTVPSSLFGLILSRIDRLEPDLRASLQVASVLGVEFTAAHFDDVVAALDDSRVSQKQLIELERRGLLERRRGPSGDTIAFRQVLVRDAVYTTVLRDNKRVLHQLAGAAIERLYAGYLDAHLPALFHHYSQTDEIERIVRYARLSGRRALSLGAFDDAATALSMAETLRGRLLELDALPAARTLVELGTSLFWVGRLRDAGARVEEGAKLLDGDDRDLVLTLRARTDLLLAEIDYQRARLSDAVAHLEAAEALFLRAGLRFDAAQARCTRGFQLRAEGRLEEGLALAREGWEILRGSNAPSAIVRAGHDLGNILRDVGDYEAAIEVFDRAIEAGEELVRSGNSQAAVWGHLAARSGRAMTLAAIGRIEEAIEAQREVYALAVEEHNPLAQVSAGFHLAQHLLQRGNLDEAEQTALRSLHLCSSLGMPAREVKCRALITEIGARREALESRSV